VDLPEFDPFARVPARLASPLASVDPQAVAFLDGLLADLRPRYAALDFAFPPGPVHGDAHPGNLLRDASGEVLLIDLEAFHQGPREWDLSLLGGYRARLDWLTEPDYRAFNEAEGPSHRDAQRP
jgi:aminoglycoside phosphotransferase (APT) family kinase protein